MQINWPEPIRCEAHDVGGCHNCDRARIANAMRDACIRAFEEAKEEGK